MKNYKRAERRRKKMIILKRRAKNYYHSTANIYSTNSERRNWAEYWENVKAGNEDVWMRHTGKVCSCDMCSVKYEKPTNEQKRKIIEEELKHL